MKFNLKLYYFFNLILMISSFTKAGRLTRRIIGGHRTQASRFPHEVNIQLETQLMAEDAFQRHPKGNTCGGSVIAKDAVLTAAHCVPEKKPRFYTITGQIDDMRERFSPNFPKLTPTQIITHEQYDPDTTTNDVAIVKVQSNNNLPPIILDSEKKSEGTRLNLAGWGLNENGEYPYYMKELSLSVKSIDFCNQVFNIYQPDKEICVTGIERDSIFYQGDSGSPVVSQNNKLVGVVSYVPDPFTRRVGAIQRVSFFSDWIKRHAPNAKFDQQSYNQDYNQGQDSYNDITPNARERETNPYYRPQSNNYQQNQNQQNWYNRQGQQNQRNRPQQQYYNPQQQQQQWNQRYNPQQQQWNKRYNPQQQWNQRYNPQQYNYNSQQQKWNQGYNPQQKQWNPQQQKWNQGYNPQQQKWNQGYNPQQKKWNPQQQKWNQGYNPQQQKWNQGYNLQQKQWNPQQQKWNQEYNPQQQKWNQGYNLQQKQWNHQQQKWNQGYNPQQQKWNPQQQKWNQGYNPQQKQWNPQQQKWN